MEVWSDEYITIQNSLEAGRASLNPEIGCPEEVSEHLAGEVVSRNPEKGAQPQQDLDAAFLETATVPYCFKCHHTHSVLQGCLD